MLSRCRSVVVIIIINILIFNIIGVIVIIYNIIFIIICNFNSHHFPVK